MPRVSIPRPVPLLVALFVAGAALSAFAGCGTISFDIEESIPATELPGDPTAVDVQVSTDPTPLMLDIDAETERQRTGPASSARLKSLTFTIRKPAGGTFYFAREVKIFMVSAGLREVEIANLSPIPDTPTINLKPVPGVELLPYARAGARIRASATGNLPREDTTYDGRVVINVKI
jgi:hypothetical protein